MSSTLPVIFLGPSMAVEDARKILDGDYRRPIRRGDMQELKPGSVVAMIDGVFDQDLAVSPQEVNEAIERGVIVFGGASMGALRAAEVPGVTGVGRIFEWYRDGLISRDDEVALLFEPDSGRPLTVPTVNIRFAVDRLARLGTIDSTTANSLVEAALSIPYQERTYRNVLMKTGFLCSPDTDALISMLQTHDLKYRDAQAVLEAVDRCMCIGQQYATTTAEYPMSAVKQIPVISPIANATLIWESGDLVEHTALIEFLVYTGRIRTNIQSNPQLVFANAAKRWGWLSSEEATITIADLGLDMNGIDRLCRDASVRTSAAGSRQDVLERLFLDGLSLKREAMRLGSLRKLASQIDGELSPREIEDTKAAICRLNNEFDFVDVRKRWALCGLEDGPAHDEFVKMVARARRVAQRLVELIGQLQTPQSCWFLTSRPKFAGDSRFCLSPAEAEAHARRVGIFIGVTRISLIGELAKLGGVQVAQAARPGNAWSSSYGSGKSRTIQGAVTGSILEEVEKWAQEKFRPHGRNLISGSFERLSSRANVVDPLDLDLPYDSVYNPTLTLDWYPGLDLFSGRSVYVPVDFLQIECRKHDICFTRRGARKHLATNGLGCGFNREEAILHGLCEYIERHAQRMAELLLSNPGGLGPHPYQFVDLTTVAEVIQDSAMKLQHEGFVVRVLDITSEIQVPTFLASITRDLQRAEGFGTHPDPNVAVEMALLEAAQTIASSTAGGREDLSIHARSLGRHERPRPLNVEDAWFWMDPDAVRAPISSIVGFVSLDVKEDIEWTLSQLRAAGLQRALVVDLTPPDIEPAVVVRVMIPGLETNNPFFTGLRARAMLLRDLVPRWL